mgnify:CR=1 FL=1
MAVADDIKVLVDWNNDGDYLDANDDVTGDALSLSWERGRDYASALLGESIAGRLSLVLLNSTGLYSPSNSSGALYGNLKPGRTIRVAVTSGTFPYTFPFVFDDAPQWEGQIERIVPSPSAAAVNTCKVEAFGVLGYLNQFQVQLASQTNRATGAAIGDILDDVGWTASDDRSLDTGQTTIPRFWISGAKTIDALRSVEEAEAGFVREGKDSKIIFEDRYYRLTTTTSTTSQATFSDASGATNPYMAIEEVDPLAAVLNHIEASATTYATPAVAVLWTLPESGAASPKLAPGQTKIYEAQYPNTSSGNNASEVDTWTTPASTTDYTANTAADGTGTDRTASVSVSVTKKAERMAISLQNTHPDDIYITKLQARGQAAETNTKVIVRAIDTTSQTVFGDRKYESKTPFHPSAELAQDWCDYHLSVYSDPVQIIGMTFDADSGSNLTQVLNREISERITLVATGDAGLGISADFFIESVQHTIVPGNHTVRWELSPASTGYSKFWLLGTGVLGTSTVPAY